MISKHLIGGTGLAIAVSMLSVGQALAAVFRFNIDSFDDQFTNPRTNSQASNDTRPRTGTSFPTSVSSPATITSNDNNLPAAQVIGGNRDLQMFSIQNVRNLTNSGESRILPTNSTRLNGYWQVNSGRGSRVSSTMIWDNIIPGADATVSNSGKFEERLNNRGGGLAFKILSVDPSNDDFTNSFTFTIRDSDGTSISVSRENILAKGSFFFDFEEFLAKAAESNVNLDLNAINYVSLNVVTGGGNNDGDGSSVQIGSVTGYEIPEPSLVLGCLTVFGASLLSLRGKQTKAEENN